MIKNFLTLFFVLFFATSLFSQAGTQVIYVDNFSSETCTYNNMLNSKHRYSNIIIDIFWSASNSRWEIYYNGTDLLFYHTADTANPPSTAAGGWVDAAIGDNDDGTTLGSISGSGTTSSLPIELFSFEGIVVKDVIQLSWTTTLEIQNDYFSVQKSVNGVDFQEIGTTKGAGTISERQEYSFIDDRPANDFNYYRLVQIDYDGTKNIQEVISIRFGKKQAIACYPNPATNELFVDTNDDWSSDVTIHIFNNNGQLMQQQSANGHDHKVAVNIEALNTGSYTIQVVSENQTYTQRFVKQ